MADFDPDAFIASNQGTTPSAASSLDDLNFDPDDFIKQNQIAQASALQSQYGSTPQAILAGIEAVARGASLGTSDYLETRTGFSTPEAIKGRIEANPIKSFAGNALGSGALIGATGGLGGLAETVGGQAAIGALFGGANAVSDYSLGDPDLNAQKVLANIGMGAAWGAGIGAISKAIQAVPSLLRTAKGIQSAEPSAEGTVLDVTGVKPTSLDEMQSRIDNFKKYGGGEGITELPQRAIASDADQRLRRLQNFPITEMQLDSLNSQEARNEFKTLLDVPGKDGEILRNYQGAQKKELIGILDDTIGKEIAPGYSPTSNALEAGERAADTFTKTIEDTRASLRPAFEALKATPLEETNHLPGIIDYLTNKESSPRANPDVANIFDTSDPDTVQFKPYSTAMGIDQSTYRAVKQAVTALQENPESFEELANIRKGLSQNIDLMKAGDASTEITNAKAALMDYIQDQVQKVSPDQDVRDIFKRWAINEQNAETIEKRFGAEIGTKNWRSLAKGGDENILSRIFRDSDSVQAAKAILSPEDFNKMLADHLAVLRENATDKGVFSSNKFNSSFKKEQYALSEGFDTDSGAYQKIKDATTLLRIFADDTPHNPSGTAKTLLQSLSKNGVDPFKYVESLIEYGKGKAEEFQAARKINKQLAGTSDGAKKLSSLQGIINKINEKTNSMVNSIFSETGKNSIKGAALSAGALLSDKAYDKVRDQIQSFVANPQLLMDSMASNSEGLHNAAPNVSQGIQNTAMSAVGFLNQKLPQSMQHMPLSPNWQPSYSQKSAFSKYYNAANSPIEAALGGIKNGMLSNETMEALQAIHPALLRDLRQRLLAKMKIDRAKELPYPQKLALSKFLGQPLDSNMLPISISNNQMSLNNPPVTNQTAVPRRRSTLGGLKQLNLANRASTLTQRMNEEK